MKQLPPPPPRLRLPVDALESELQAMARDQEHGFPRIPPLLPGDLYPKRRDELDGVQILLRFLQLLLVAVFALLLYALWRS